ncbi:Tn3 family transposase (plasmid) [Bacillus bombysepticus]|nr:Tn3 family transposase [Bacillus bombysepticus]
MINTNARDAVHVIDGLLHHESDLSIEEHYTDTAGYTDQVFGLTHLLGFRFAPRIRDLSDSKLYVIGKPSDFPKLENLLRGQIDMKVIRGNYDDVLRLAHSIQNDQPTSLIQRYATVEEVADTIVFLASENASAINGVAQRVEGGIIQSIL